MLPDCAKVTVDEDGDLCSCVTWNGGICDILFNSSSSISTLLKPGRTYPYDVWVIWANWPIWEVLLYNFRNLFLVVQPPHSFKRSSYLPFFVLLPLVPWSLSLSLYATKMIFMTKISCGTTTMASCKISSGTTKKPSLISIGNYTLSLLDG